MKKKMKINSHNTSSPFSSVCRDFEIAYLYISCVLIRRPLCRHSKMAPWLGRITHGRMASTFSGQLSSVVKEDAGKTRRGELGALISKSRTNLNKLKTKAYIKAIFHYGTAANGFNRVRVLCL